VCGRSFIQRARDLRVHGIEFRVRGYSVTQSGPLTNPPSHLWRDKWTALSGPLSVTVIRTTSCWRYLSPFDSQSCAGLKESCPPRQKSKVERFKAKVEPLLNLGNLTVVNLGKLTVECRDSHQPAELVHLLIPPATYGVTSEPP